MNYRYRSPIAFSILHWGFSIRLQFPRVQIRKPLPTDPEDSMMIYYGIFDDD